MGFFGGLFGGNSKQTVSQKSVNETTINSAVSVDNEIIIDMSALTKIFDNIAISLNGFIKLFSASKEQELKLGLLDELLKAKRQEVTNNILIKQGTRLIKQIGLFISGLFFIWVIVKLIRG